MRETTPAGGSGSEGVVPEKKIVGYRMARSASSSVVSQVSVSSLAITVEVLRLGILRDLFPISVGICRTKWSEPYKSPCTGMSAARQMIKIDELCECGSWIIIPIALESQRIMALLILFYLIIIIISRCMIDDLATGGQRLLHMLHVHLVRKHV
jgi:hypothetical protein